MTTTPTGAAMLYQSAPKMPKVGTRSGDVTLTSAEIATALIPAMIGVAAVALIALLMLA